MKTLGFRIRGGLINGEPYFVLTDVCKALELSNTTMVAQSIDEDDLNTTEVIDRMGRKQKAHIVNESGLYQVIFQSRKLEENVDFITISQKSEVGVTVKDITEYILTLDTAKHLAMASRTPKGRETFKLLIKA